MHNDHLDPDRHLPPDCSEAEWWDIMETNCKEILKAYSAKHWGDVYRAAYKYTDCGPSIGVAVAECDQQYYCDRLDDVSIDDPVVEIFISSIVEGVERTTDTECIDMKIPGALQRFRDGLDAINKEANEIWNATHGCEGCAKKHKRRYELGDTPVHPKCRQCKGEGEVI